MIIYVVLWHGKKSSKTSSQVLERSKPRVKIYWLIYSIMYSIFDTYFAACLFADNVIIWEYFLLKKILKKTELTRI